MGRALFSLSYPTATVVKTEPEPLGDRCERWSITNNFDPDSDEFFNNAEYEAFVDPVQFASQPSQGSGPLAAPDVSSDTSVENSPTDATSPMAMGSDDPAILLANSITEAEWQRLLESGSAESELLRDRSSRRAMSIIAQQSYRPYRPANQNALRGNRQRSLSSLPPALPTSPIRGAGSAALDSTSPIMIRSSNLTPIDIPVNASSASSPMSPETPSPATPPAHSSPMQMFTPSPPTTVSPRVYSWQRHAIPAIPTSPTLARYRDGLLATARPRMPVTRIEVVPARIRVQGTVM